MFPSKAPDLFATHPTIVHGRWRGTPPESVTVHAREHGRTTTIPVRVVKSREDDTLLARLWAREQIAELETRIWAGEDRDAVAAIERLGLEHRLVTHYTSLIAIDSSRRVGGESKMIEQPTYAPEGVDVEMAGGRSYETLAVVPGGISIGGGTTSESKYTVEGASVNNPRFGAVSATVVQDYIYDRPINSVVGVQHHRHTSMSLMKVGGGTLAGRHSIRRSIRARRFALRRCLAGHDAGSGLDLTLNVEVGEEVHATLDADTGLSAAKAACIERVVADASWKHIAAGTYRIAFRLVTE
jgi:Ca-activated chloride channel family protein